MTDFKVGDVIVTPSDTVIRIEKAAHHDDVFVATNIIGYHTSHSAAYLSECKMATGADRARFKAMRLDALSSEISSLYEDIDHLKREIEEEKQMP